MAEQTTHTLPLREKVPSSDKWHIEDIFADDNAFLAALPHAAPISMHCPNLKTISEILPKHFAIT